MTDVAALPVPVQRWLARQRQGVTRPDALRPDALRPAAPRPAGPAIRRRRPSELPACSRLLRLVSAEGGYPLPRPASLREWLTGPDVLDAWIAHRDGEVLGHVAVTTVGSDAASAMRWREVTGRATSELGGVSRLFVRSRVRGEGLGTRLLATAAADLRTRGLLPVAELVSSSRAGVRLYEREGWRLVARCPWGPRGNDLASYMYVLPPGAPLSGR